MAKKFPIHPKNPERICWGCEKYCTAADLQCGNGCERIQHPIETDELGLKPAPAAAPSAKPHIKLPLLGKKKETV